MKNLLEVPTHFVEQGDQFGRRAGGKLGEVMIDDRGLRVMIPDTPQAHADDGLGGGPRWLMAWLRRSRVRWPAAYWVVATRAAFSVDQSPLTRL
jgi:hypothetical protein